MHALAMRQERDGKRRQRRPIRAKACFAGVIAMVLLASNLPAQITPSGFAASAHIDSAYYHGDTLFITHTVSNSAASRQSLWGFILEAPAPIAVQRQPSTGDWFLNIGVFDHHPSVEWFGLGDEDVTLPGSHTPPLSSGAIGVPTIVSYWAVALTPPKQTDNPDREPADDPMLQRSIVGKTVGIERIPSGSTPLLLTTRLRSLLTSACGQIDWITQPGICRSLDAKLSKAQAALVQGNTTLAREELGAFSNELLAQYGVQPGKHVSTEAFALLSLNAAFLLPRL